MYNAVPKLRSNRKLKKNSKWQIVKQYLGTDKLRTKTSNASDLDFKYSSSNGLLFGKYVRAEDYNDFFDALTTHPINRTDDHMLMLKLFCADIEALQHIPLSNFNSICRSLTHQRLKRGDILCKKGDDADGAYVVATGSVNVEVNGNVVATFKAGDFFGDYGLQNKDAKRTADCRAGSVVDIISIPRRIYKHYMLDHLHHNRDMKKKYFLRKLCAPIYPRTATPKFTDEKFTKQMDWMICKSFKKGDIIGKQGHPCKKLYFIISGVVRVLRSIMHNAKVTVCDVGYYRKGQWFGTMYSGVYERNVHTWIADQTVTVYMINRADFLRLFGRDSVELYKKFANTLLSEDRELKQEFRTQKLWKIYKKQLMDSVSTGELDPKWLHPPKHQANQCKDGILVDFALRMNRGGADENIDGILKDYDFDC